MRIGEQIKNYRKTEGLTQEQVANYLGVSTPAVNKWEKGIHIRISHYFQLWHDY